VKRLAPAAFVCCLALIAGCGDPSSPTGTLPIVTGLVVVDSLCSGTQVVLSWNSVPDVDGYRVYWSETTGYWDEIVNVADTTCVDDVASRDAGSGYYTVLAFKGVDTSEDYAEYANTFPAFCGSYTIWSNHAPDDSVDAVIFGETTGLLGIAEDSAFVQDAYCYDGDWAQSPVGLYSGSLPPYGDGDYTVMAKGNDPCIAPDSGYTESIHLIENDRLFLELTSGNYVKLFVDGIPTDTLPPDSLVYGLTFHYWYQPIEGLRVFGSL
jgi:hypothetical protein